jgi:hypothetical protein
VSELRGHHDELEPDTLGGFHVRWYQHHGGRRIGPFDTMDDLAAYMAREDLPRPDELLAPVE